MTAKQAIEKTSRARQRAARSAGEYYYGIINRYGYKVPTALEDVYNSYSIYKARAYKYCRELCEALNGYDFIITGHNCMTFSVLFKFDDEQGRLCYGYITRDYDSFARAED